MSTDELLARVYHAVISGFVRDGRAPHHTVLATELGVTADEALDLQRNLIDELGGPHWADPSNDLIASFAPFSNVPTHYQITVDRQQKWWGQ